MLQCRRCVQPASEHSVPLVVLVDESDFDLSEDLLESALVPLDVTSAGAIVDTGSGLESTTTGVKTGVGETAAAFCG